MPCCTTISATDDPGVADPATLAPRDERIALDFGVERDAGRRFALWALLAVLGDAPDPRRRVQGCRPRARRRTNSPG